MTSRIYYTDPCLSFDATVRRSLVYDGRPAVVLDRTAFYPTSGGQPFDTGRLNATEVVEVVDEGDEVIHVLASPLPEGERVTGDIDASRRLDHMQQHTGQHVLSAALDRLAGNRTVSFHLGGDICTIDLEHEIAPADLTRAVAEANRVVWDDRPVSIRFASAEDAARLPLRKEPVREGTLRLIEVEDFDVSACGGTHVARTGEVGIIAVLATERARGGVRVTFVCGGRALKALETYRDAIAGSVRVLSVLPHELPAAVERVHVEARDLRKTVTRLQERLAGFEAERLVQQASPIAAIRAAGDVVDGWDIAGLKTIASAATRQDGVVAVVVSSTSPAAIAVARSRDVQMDAAQLLKSLMATFGGRGGGKPELAQGGGLNAPGREILAAVMEWIATTAPGLRLPGSGE